MLKTKERERTRPALLNIVFWIVVPASFLSLIAVLFVVPGPFLYTEAKADAGIVITERDGRETAITVYRDGGANPLARLFSDRTGGVRITAIDLETGDTVWDERIHELQDTDRFLGSRRLLGAGEKNVFLRTTFNVYVFSITDGSLVATDEDIPGFEVATSTLGHIVHREGTKDLLFMGGDRHTDTLQVLDMDTLEIRDPDTETAATWSCVLDRTGTPYDDHAMSNASLQTWGTEYTAEGSASFYVLGRLMMVPPLEDACAEAIREEDVFPDGQTTAEVLGQGTGRLLAVRSTGPGASALHVIDESSGMILDTSSRILTTTHAAQSPSGRFAIVAERDLTGIAPAVGKDARSSVIYVVDGAGSIHETTLGRHGWFGLAW